VVGAEAWRGATSSPASALGDASRGEGGGRFIDRMGERSPALEPVARGSDLSPPGDGPAWTRSMGFGVGPEASRAARTDMVELCHGGLIDRVYGAADVAAIHLGKSVRLWNGFLGRVKVRGWLVYGPGL
jgi:hypothetical protein